MVKKSGIGAQLQLFKHVEKCWAAENQQVLPRISRLLEELMEELHCAERLLFERTRTSHACLQSAGFARLQELGAPCYKSRFEHRIFDGC